MTFAPVVFISDSFINAVEPLPIGFEIPGTTALVHANVAPTVELVAVYATASLLQTVFVAALVITAFGFTVIVNVCAEPEHDTLLFENEGVTVIVAVTGAVVALEAVKEAILPVPLAARPIEVVLFVQL